MALTPEERKDRARLAAHSMHAKGGTNTRPATAAFLSKFEKEVDPDGILAPAERAKRAEHAKKAHFARLSFLAAKAQREAKGAVE